MRLSSITIGNGAGIISTRCITSVNRFNAGNQDDIGAYKVKFGYEINSVVKLDRDRFVFIEYRNDDEIKAVAMYVDYNGWSMTFHIHAPGHLHKNVIKEFLKYPFHEANVKILFAPVKASNKTIISIAKRVGFREHATIPDYYGLNEDQIIFRAQASDVSRWIE